MLGKVAKFFPLGVAITGICGLIFWAVQQDIRIGSYEPQIQMSEDAAARLSAGESPSKVVTGENIEISKSLAPYIMVMDESGKVLAGNAMLNGKTPKVLQGVLDYTKAHGQDRISWQPAPNVRSAIIVTRFSNSKISGSVLAGRSLRESEKRVELLAKQVALAWLTTLLASFFAFIIL